MSKTDFTAEEFVNRRRRVRDAVKAAGLDWMILFHPVSIHWLTGSDAKGFQAFQCLLVSAADGRLVMFTRESERAEFQDDALYDELLIWGGPEPEDPVTALDRHLKRLGVPGTRIGMEVPAYYLHAAHYGRMKAMLGASLVAEPSNLVHDLKLVKSEAELAYIREAARINDKTIDTLRQELRPGRSELDVVADILKTMLVSGGGFPPTPPNFVSGPRASFSHGAPTARLLQRGDTGNAEYCSTYKRYASSIGRQFTLGPPSKRLSELFAITRAAGDACIAAIRDGVPAIEPHNAAKRVMSEHGTDQYRVHLTGYGLAPAVPPATAEPVSLFGDSRYVLKAGMVLSICPPLFIAEEQIGVRLCDNVLVTANGCERLSKQPRELIVID
jgi:Xaa-Pro dipeptidase